MKTLLMLWAVVASLPLTLSAGQQPLDRVIGESIRLRVPVSACEVPGVAARISQSLEIPAGIEYFPELCATHPPDPASEEVLLAGLTAREAFDKLVNLDPRFQWIESDGVVVFRPLAAWTNPKHFLHRSIPDFTLADVGLQSALEAVRTALGPAVVSSGPDIPGRTPQGSQHVSVSLGATSPLEALNAIVRAHGSMRWRVTYCRPEPRLEFAELGYFTFDGSGLVLGPRFQKDEKGKSDDQCRKQN